MRKKSGTILLAGILAIGMVGCGKKKESSASTQTAKTSTPQIKVIKGVVKKVHKKAASEENNGQFYYSYNTEKNASKKEPKTRTTLDAYLNIHSPYERVQITLMIKHLSRDFIVRCSPCHDDYANGIIGPSLLGKSGDYIYQHLIDFKTGKKKNVLMKELVSQIDNTKLRSIADEIATFNQQVQKLRKGIQ